MHTLSKAAATTRKFTPATIKGPFHLFSNLRSLRHPPSYPSFTLHIQIHRFKSLYSTVTTVSDNMPEQPKLRIAVEGCVSHWLPLNLILLIHVPCPVRTTDHLHQGHGTLHSIYASVKESSRIKGWDGVDVLIIGGDFQVGLLCIPAQHDQISLFARLFEINLTLVSPRCQQNIAKWLIFMNTTGEHDELHT
jgi:hypothetical protein